MAPPVAAAVLGAALGLDPVRVAERIRSHIAAVRRSGPAADDHDVIVA